MQIEGRPVSPHFRESRYECGLVVWWYGRIACDAGNALTVHPVCVCVCVCVRGCVCVGGKG